MSSEEDFSLPVRPGGNVWEHNFTRPLLETSGGRLPSSSEEIHSRPITTTVPSMAFAISLSETSNPNKSNSSLPEISKGEVLNICNKLSLFTFYRQ